MRAIYLALVILPAAWSAFAPQAGAAPPQSQQMTAEEGVGVVFTEIEKRLIRDYFAKSDSRAEADHGKGKGKSKQMPPGLAKRDRLPPGLERHIEKNGTLPPGLAKRDLPSDLVGRLPPLKHGLERKIVGNDVVLLRKGTNVVLDVLENVLNNQ